MTFEGACDMTLSDRRERKERCSSHWLPAQTIPHQCYPFETKVTNLISALVR